MKRIRRSNPPNAHEYAIVETFIRFVILPPSKTRNISAFAIFATHIAPSASKQIPSGVKLSGLAQTRRFKSPPSGKISTLVSLVVNIRLFPLLKKLVIFFNFNVRSLIVGFNSSIALLFFYLLTDRLIHSNAALLSTLLLIIHPKFVEFKHEGRQEAFSEIIISIFRSFINSRIFL